MPKTLRVLALSSAMAVLAGCATGDVRDQIQNDAPSARSAIDRSLTPASSGRAIANPEVFIPASKVSVATAQSWLTGRPVSLKQFDRPTSLAEIVRMLAADGLNIASDMPLDGYIYAGTVNATTAEAALKQILGSVGLDFHVDDGRRLVTITPMAAKTWYINLGDRRSTFSTNASQGSGSSSGGSSMGGEGDGSGGGQGQQNQGGLSGSSSSGSSAGSGGAGGGTFGGSGENTAGGMGSNGASGASQGHGGTGNSINVTDTFWPTLERELRSRLTVLVPRAMTDGGIGMGAGTMPPMPMAGGVLAGMPPQQPMVTRNGGSGDDGKFVAQQVGSYSINPTTGAITVQAPHWVLVGLDAYFDRVRAMYNTDITFTGELVTLTSSNTHSEGLDVSSFASFAQGRYGAIVSNNALGGVTVSLPGGSGIPNVSAGAQTVGGALVGVASKADGLQIFNAFLQSLGNVKVTQRPVLTTTSGVPGEFTKISSIYYNTVSQQAASGGVGGAALATNNTLQRQDFGVLLRINPRYDVATGLIRAQISLVNVIPAGEQTVQQTISVGTGSQSVPQTIPLATQLKYSGEALLRDGDLIVVGGQSEDQSQADESGLPSGGKAPLGGIFGTKKSTRSTGTYYFALRVSVHPR